MKRRLILSGFGSCAALLSGLLVPSLVAPANAAAPAATDVIVGSFNINSVSFDPKAAGEHKKWRERRPAVVGQILQQQLDVVGLQEANQSNKYAAWLDFGVNQYLDLKGALNARGANYQLTNANAYNCAKPTSSYNCVYKNQGAAQDNRILYNANRVSMVSQGAVKFTTQTAGKNERYLAYAVLKMKATGKEFFFTTTHLDPYSEATRNAQWTESIKLTNQLKGSRPVIATGDYNTSKWDSAAARFLPAMKNNGYGDVLNQQAASATTPRQRSESLRRAWVNSFNGYKRDVRSYAYEDARHKLGNNIDFIFASNHVRVKQFSNVTAVDSRTLRIKGVIPSDHALIRATLVL